MCLLEPVRGGIGISEGDSVGIINEIVIGLIDDIGLQNFEIAK